jgi:hypothetical protein
MSRRENGLTLGASCVFPQSDLDDLKTRCLVALADEIAVFRAQVDQDRVGALITSCMSFEWEVPIELVGHAGVLDQHREFVA